MTDIISDILAANGVVFFLGTDGYVDTDTNTALSEITDYFDPTHVSGEVNEQAKPSWRPHTMLVDMQTGEVKLADFLDAQGDLIGNDPSEYVQAAVECNSD